MTPSSTSPAPSHELNQQTTNAPTNAPIPVAVTHDDARSLLRELILLRRFEDRCVELYGEGAIRGFLHLYNGEEAVATGVCRALTSDDAVVATYREHGQALARGLPPRAVMAELLGKVEGCSRGRGGSMHLFDVSRRFYGGNAIVGGGLPLAAGLALADQVRHRPGVTACFFGEGAVDEGVFHETMNMAVLWSLPVLFICENNLYSMGTPLSVAEANVELVQKAASYGMHAEVVDGMDVLAVARAARAAVDVVRAGAPVFLEMKTYRFRAHSMFDAQLYRTREEVDHWKQRDPILVLRRRVPSLSDDDVVALEADVDAVIDDAVAFARAGTLEDPRTLLEEVTGPAPRVPAPATTPTQATTTTTTRKKKKTTYRACMRDAIHDVLEREPLSFVMGEDVGAYGGCYAVTKGLKDEWGPLRVRDTPLCEAAIVGIGIGAAIGGVRPLVEVMTCNFSLLALDQLIHNAATLRHMSGGQVRVPVVVRMATGAGRQLAAQHSHSFEGWLAHVPGLRILAPATLEDARGMLPTALRSEDPVLLFEHIGLYNVEGEIDADAGAVDLEHARLAREGTDVVVVTWGGALSVCEQAARELESEHVSVAVLDLRVLRPLDDDAIVDAVARCHRVVVVDEGWRSGGLSAEVIARINERCFFDLDAPPMRVCAAEVPIPYPKHLEAAALPSVARVKDAVHAVLAGHAHG